MIFFVQSFILNLFRIKKYVLFIIKLMVMFTIKARKISVFFMKIFVTETANEIIEMQLFRKTFGKLGFNQG